jgi:endonuclease YncB( thermonuclease family)
LSLLVRQLSQKVDKLRATEFSSLVVSVIDGDTIEVLHSENPEPIRLNGIDCPEKAQTFGQRAKQATSELVFGKDVVLQTPRTGRVSRSRTCSYRMEEGLTRFSSRMAGASGIGRMLQEM